jgi:hypothetical protein
MLIELAVHVSGHATIEGQERSLPPWRELRAQLLDDGRAAADVGGVIEDGVVE